MIITLCNTEWVFGLVENSVENGQNSAEYRCIAEFLSVENSISRVKAVVFHILHIVFNITILLYFFV